MIITEHIATNRNIIDIPLIFVCIGARNDNFDSWKTLGKRLRYYGFEPDKDECTKLNKKITDENVPWTHHYYPLALAKENGQSEFQGDDISQGIDRYYSFFNMFDSIFSDDKKAIVHNFEVTELTKDSTPTIRHLSPLKIKLRPPLPQALRARA